MIERPQGPPEPVMSPCGKCGVPIQTLWAAGNHGLETGDYVLIADTVFHPECWDEITAQAEAEGVFA